MIRWRKSSRSGGGGDGGQECVELAALVQGVGVRDSRDPQGGHLCLSARVFAELLDRVKRYEANF
ncbi:MULTISPECIES: DUF397 domain-containing protein [Actinomadura]|uniref:DUF397 domain-containing protein n=1 Tax=Actinomadura yumaensis TaxID=111807 RepID=A0ABW2CF73_9ACTN|nr:DUF397 domain-containing protein [Actinomadura sp. J1-007]MWK35545.1 DUF397 domain-containing protein [Actinomadura sp. J1-007]